MLQEFVVWWLWIGIRSMNNYTRSCTGATIYYDYGPIDFHLVKVPCSPQKNLYGLQKVPILVGRIVTIINKEENFGLNAPNMVICESYEGAADEEDSIIGFPRDWAPNDLVFYEGDAFPARYKNGAFIAFHGSTNRALIPAIGLYCGFRSF